MTRARALVAAVPPRVWAAVAGLVLLASLGVTLVLGAGLATWRGGVTHEPLAGGARPPATVLTPPGSAVVVVPTPGQHGGTPPPGTVPVAASGGAGTGDAAGAPAPAPTPGAAPPPAVTGPTAAPRAVGTGQVALPHTAPGHAKTHSIVTEGGCSPHGKHLGWAKRGKATAAAIGHAVGHARRHGC
jgi:hypothetical protein